MYREINLIKKNLEIYNKFKKKKRNDVAVERKITKEIGNLFGEEDEV